MVIGNGKDRITEMLSMKQQYSQDYGHGHREEKGRDNMKITEMLSRKQQYSWYS